MSATEVVTLGIAVLSLSGFWFFASAWQYAENLSNKMEGERDHWQQRAEAAERRAAQVQLQSANLHADLRAYRMASEKYKAVADAVTRSISELNRAMALLVDADTLLKQAMQQDEGGDDDA